jgi:phosphate transport system protein
MGEYRREFADELERIEGKVIELFAMVAEDVPLATQALLNGDGAAYMTLAERDRAIDALYVEVEALVNREILLQAPVAADLRFLLSVLRIVPELERSHDLVVHVAAIGSHLLGGGLTSRAKGLVARMGDLAAGMWRQAADSWYQRDRTAAQALAERDEGLDELHASLIAELASGHLAVPVAMEMAQVARDYERLGAHAVNIARRVVYLAGTTPGRPAGDLAASGCHHASQHSFRMLFLLFRRCLSAGRHARTESACRTQAVNRVVCAFAPPPRRTGTRANCRVAPCPVTGRIGPALTLNCPFKQLVARPQGAREAGGSRWDRRWSAACDHSSGRVPLRHDAR